jgi:hypothetical protein
LAERVDRIIGWPRLPTVLAIPVLIGLREQLRSKNLVDTGRGTIGAPSEHLTTAASLSGRTLTGRHNNLADPLMGAVGSRFGRNVPLTRAYGEQPAELFEPNPRLISRRLLVRDQIFAGMPMVNTDQLSGQGGFIYLIDPNGRLIRLRHEGFRSGDPAFSVPTIAGDQGIPIQSWLTITRAFAARM